MLGNISAFIRKNAIVLSFVLLLIIYDCKGNFSNNSSTTEWCYFNSLSAMEKMSYCKFRCWSEKNLHLPLENVVLRRSIASFNVQITGKNCTEEVVSIHLSYLEKLSNFLILGHMKTFNLTFLILEAPNLKRLTISSLELSNLIADNLKETQIKSLYLTGMFDPKKWQFLKSSNKTLESFYLTLNKKIIVPERLFYEMPEIQFLNLNIVAEKLSTNSISNLRKLTFLSLQNNNFENPIKFQKEIFSNLPSLRTMRIINFEIENYNLSENFCSKLSGKVESFLLEASSIIFIERCMEVWRCDDCGKVGSEILQVMEFKSLLVNFKAQNTRLDDILPDPSIMYTLNTTKLHIVDTHIPIITNSSLARFPLLTHYHHHRILRLNERSKVFNSFGDIDRFLDNPFFMLLNGKSKLMEVRISISICDCVSFTVYKSLLFHKVSVFFYCRNLASQYEAVNSDTWINPTFYEQYMNLKCLAGGQGFNLGLIIIMCFGFQIIMFHY